MTKFSTENNFDFLRFFAACLVFIGHAFILYGNPPVGLFPYSLEQSGVFIFFTISGFLITASWKHNPSLTTFFRNRALRIFPGLFFPVLAGAYILGPLVTSLPVADYFLHPQTHSYLLNLLLITIRPLPGVFTGNPHPNDVNGALWTLPFEFLMYCAVAIAGSRGRFLTLLASTCLWGSGLILFFYLLAYFQHFPSLVPIAIFHMLGFILGALMQRYSKHIPLRPAYALAAFFIAVLGCYKNQPLLYLLTVPYLTIFCAFSKAIPLQNWGKYGDFSYGMYIYAVLVQQTLVHLFQHMHFMLYLLEGFVITLCFAFLSWHLVEKRALWLKKKPMHIAVSTA